MQKRLIERDALAQITKEIRHREPAGLIEEPPRRASAHIVSELGLLSGQPAE
jgi:hypothetical protein